MGVGAGDEGRLAGDEGRLAGDEGRLAGDEGRLAGDEGRLAGDEGRLAGTAWRSLDGVVVLEVQNHQGESPPGRPPRMRSHVLCQASTFHMLYHLLEMG
ncbi:hypothetical protein NDU88_000478 [Pleurodeles waltl]|uniref:Uncharacterized protein n=1 Tax=Pleurodeles waltl TaxID=8319 RepID=A0AAV7LY93_PLEWA|nr:hypothetical protein NDU88_000478 [Pleurodeles waltl]